MKNSAALFCSVLLGSLLAAAQSHSSSPHGIILGELTWQQAEKVLTAETIVVIPLGAGSKEHGPHLQLQNDFLMAQYLTRQVRRLANVVIAPTINYSYYPAFVEYPGATSLRLETARDTVEDICRGLARFGPRKFYVLNTGVSTQRPLGQAATDLAKDGITMHYTDIGKTTAELEKTLVKQEGGTHADEVETSIMLYIAPKSVDMTKAVKDYHQGTGPLTRDPNNHVGTYSPTGTWGDPTLATRAKGKKLTEAMVASILAEIEALRTAK